MRKSSEGAEMLEQGKNGCEAPISRIAARARDE